MKNWKLLNRLPVYISIGGVAAVLSACGASSTSFLGSAGTGATGSTASSAAPTPTPSSTITSEADALSFSNIAVTGTGGTNPTYNTYSATGAYIQTDNVLKVRVTAEPGTSLLSVPGLYSGFSANYDCASFQVSIYDDSGSMIGSQETGMLQVAGTSPCINSTGSAYQDLDFSGSVVNPHGGISVQIQALSYDWYCQLWYNDYDLYGAASPYYSDYSFFCPSKAVYKNHTVDASIEVETNGTQFF